MKIGEIRDIIRGAQWTRNDLTGGTSEEFRRQRVAERLTEKIAELQALSIAARFAEDIKHRDEEIARCRQVIERWHAAQVAPPQPAPTQHKCIFLGGFSCIQCGAPFKPKGAA